MAIKLKPVLEKNHRLLVTLLLMNALSLEYMPLFLSKIVTEVNAILISVTAVLFLGEVVPQAICLGPLKYQIAVFLIPLVKFLLVVTSPINYPLGFLLDKLVGEHKLTRFSKKEFDSLMLLHFEEKHDKMKE